jgi:hypothetical protein
MEKEERFGEKCARGEIRIGEFAEIFFCLVGVLEKIDYYRN